MTFERENRYFIAKCTDVTYLSTEHQKMLMEVMFAVANVRGFRGKKPLECVVVESDWPEYEPVWNMIEDRMAGDDGLPGYTGCTGGVNCPMPHQCGEAGQCLYPENESSRFVAEPLDLVSEMLEALEAVVRVADRATVEFDMARAAIAKAKGE